MSASNASSEKSDWFTVEESNDIEAVLKKSGFVELESGVSQLRVNLSPPKKAKAITWSGDLKQNSKVVKLVEVEVRLPRILVERDNNFNTGKLQVFYK